MKDGKKQIEKLCGFYVSDWHLSTMLLPYISRKIGENVKIVTILENSIRENVKQLVEKLNLKNKEQILEINWESSKKYSDIQEKLEKQLKENMQNIILINGCSNYIQKSNEEIEKWFQKSKFSSLKVINFFEVGQLNQNITEILSKHDKILNTSGEKEISEVFEGYSKSDLTKKRKSCKI